MTPGARVQAAIDILQAIGEGRAADRQIESYFRARRYAGSKDRAAIAALVFDILRARAGHVWRLEQAGAGITPRNLALAEIVVTGQDPAMLFSGQGHSPAALSGDETTLIAKIGRDLGAAPDWVKGNYPEWLEASLRRRFGARLLDEMVALNARAPVDLRVNALRTSRAEIQGELDRLGIAAAPTPYSPLGLRLAGRVKPEQLPQLRDGLVELQDEGSQIAALLLGAKPGEQVVDFCAGAGGKALALAGQMMRKGQVYACDTDARRLERLKPRAKRAEAHNIQPHVLRADDPWLGDMAGKAHRVLVDAPCSGTGTWRRNPEARWRYRSADIAAFAKSQGALLDQAAMLVKKDGRLAYVVCSLLPEEGEDVIAGFLARHSAFEILPAERAWAETIGSAYPGEGHHLMLTPARHGTDGFFIALMTRRE